MRLLISLLLSFASVTTAQQFGYSVTGQGAGAWTEILGSAGLLPKAQAEAAILIIAPGVATLPGWEARVNSGAILILEGDSPVARGLGFRLQDRIVRLNTLSDIHQPETPLILEQSLDISEPSVPTEARVFTRERWTQVPVVAGFRRGKGAVLWLAASPGKHGYERFPFLLNALADLGLEFPLRGNRLWAFFDYSYRTRIDVNWFAKRWHASGIAALQVAAWHFYDQDPERDRYLKALIEACHKEGVLVYAWLELPHVSERFWSDHPAWREKTALLQDAQLDWRKLMNLADPACAAAVRDGVGLLAKRFDWDGLNFAELYYESLEGASNPARFTPMNQTVRDRFRATPGGFDPIELWSTRKDATSLRKFLEFRVEMARNLQNEWLAEAERYRTFQPDLDLVLTHVDDRLDTGMRDAIGADTSRLLPLLEKHRFTFLVEDPATVWDQGPQRYPLIASKYPKSDRIAIDINIVERYQDVYPTKQQTGLELFGLVNLATRSFGRVALYFENSLAKADLSLLAASASDFDRASWEGTRLSLHSPRGGGIRWEGEALVDGAPWPVQENGTVWLSPGAHVLERSAATHEFRLLSSSGSLSGATYVPRGVQFGYNSDAREIARFSGPVGRMILDGAPLPLAAATATVILPRGKHSVIAWPQADDSGSGQRANTR